MYRKETILWPEGQPPEQRFCDEDERLAVLAAHSVPGLVDDAELQQIVDFAAALCETPRAMVTVVERDRQLFLARADGETRETPRPTSFCAHAMLQADPLVVADASEDERFADFDLVVGGPKIRFYAGWPLISTEGAPLGALCVFSPEPRPQGLTQLQRSGLEVLAKSVMRRLSQRRLGDEAVAAVDDREKALRSFIDSVPGIAWSTDPDGRFDYVNARFTEWTGVAPPRTNEDWNAVIHPDDWAETLEKFQAAIAAQEPFEDEWRLRMADGSYRWISSRALPATDGGVTRWFGTITDIDAVTRESEGRDLLARELSHRIKNIFAIVAGLVSLRARAHDSVDGFARELTDTVHALGRAHDYVRPLEGRKGDSLRGLLADLLEPYRNGNDERIAIQGDDRAIGADAATPLALVFHELATNSAKYGALSTDYGTVSVTIQPDVQRNCIQVIWRETAGATPPAEQSREGFGSRLVRIAVEGQLGGTIERHFGEDGIRVELTVCADALAR